MIQKQDSAEGDEKVKGRVSLPITSFKTAERSQKSLQLTSGRSINVSTLQG